LLFDGENFTRSRKYFWAIGCLHEFIINIADNIKQWDMYYEACLKDLVEPEEWVNLSDAIDAASVLAPGLVERTYRTFWLQNGERELESIIHMIKKGKTIVRL
jgi:hypothetical protein